MKRCALVGRWLLVLLLAGGVAAVVIQQRAASELQRENAALQAEAQEAQQLRAENKEIERLRAEAAEAERLRKENESLPGLRNQIRQVRRQAADLDSLRAENSRLAAANTGGPVSKALPPDFIPKSALADVGLGSPEATVQTMLAAMCQGNLDRLSQCEMSGQMGRNADLDWERRQLVDRMSRFQGFRIAERRDLSDDHVVLSVQSSAGGVIMPMKLSRVGGEWKLEN